MNDISKAIRNKTLDEVIQLCKDAIDDITILSTSGFVIQDKMYLAGRLEEVKMLLKAIQDLKEET